MPLLTKLVQHAAVTTRSNFHYQFTPKHHGYDPQAAQWLPSLTLDEEFEVFNNADVHRLSDERGYLYGVRRSGEVLQDLGTWAQQIAEFPTASVGQPWHGYPIWSVNDLAPSNRRGESMRPGRDVFFRMEGAGLLTVRERKRLLKGDHA